MRGWWFALALTAGCTKSGEETDTDTNAPVNEGPVLSEVVPAPLVQGQPTTFAVNATDSDVVEQVSLYYRSQGESTWETAYLVRSGDIWSTEVPGVQIEAPAFEWYFRAQDAADVPAVTYLPDNGLHPLSAPVQVIGQPLPMLEGFEDAGVAGLYDLGWDEQADGFPGYTWELAQTHPFAGAANVRHRRGVDGLTPFVDWLISPPLDFTAQTDVELSWMEYGDFTELADHSLWISTTSGNPDDGGFTLLTDLPAPLEDQWSSSGIYDLSEYAGSTSVWVAWLYNGDFTDAWELDEISVQPMGPELQLVDATEPPDAIEPGDTLTVSVDVTNLTRIAAEGVTVTFDAGDLGEFADNPQTELSVAGNGSTTWTSELTLAGDVPDNSRVPFTVSATDGVETWTLEASLIVGEPSSASIAVNVTTAGLLQLSVGTGDPADPEYEQSVASQAVIAGNYSWTPDLTEVSSLLPPGPGLDRWWVRIDGDATGSLSRFELNWDGSTFQSDDLRAFDGLNADIYWLPRPPSPVVTTSTSVPTVVTPGSHVVLTLDVDNRGSAMIGAGTVVLTSADEDAVITTVEPQVLPDNWAPSATVPLVFEFDVSADHVDSTSLNLELTFQDTVEAITVPVTVDVPWAVLQATSVRIRDDAGDDDGLLDANESANLDIQLTNVGDLAPLASVSCILSQKTGPTVTIVEANGSFGTIPVGTSRDERDFEIRTGAASVGDSMEMQLDCTDGTHPYIAEFELVIGEPPWLPLSLTGDPRGDNVGSYGFDFIRGQYRSDGVTLDIRFESAVPYNLGTLFLESWMESIGANYTYYQLVLQSGNAKLRGYDFGVFTQLLVPEITPEDATTLTISFPLSPLSLTLDRLSAGFGAGFCGGDTYYCDHFPNAWGDPYQVGFNEENFAEMSW